MGPVSVSLTRFRGSMLRDMAAAGHEVLAVAPEDDRDVRRELASDGIRYATVPMARAGLNPFRDAMTLASLLRVFRDQRADVVLVYAPKPVVYGSLAARMAGVPRRSAMVTGVGSALGGNDGLQRRLLAHSLRLLYRVALRGTHVVFFQNGDDERMFRDLSLVGQRNRIVHINGSGVDLDYYAKAPAPPPPVTFLMIGRLIADKGVREYVNAARLARERLADARFLLLGPLDPNPSAISEAELAGWREEGIIEYLGSTDDVRPLLAQAHVCVLPSYREGMPRSVLEAMSMGRAVLTTDAPGCRDTVVEGQNGYLVPIRDASALADRMVDMARDPDGLARMGQHSRTLAEARFDVRSVNQTIMDALELGGGVGSTSKERDDGRG